MTMRRMGDVATDVLLDEVLGGRVDEMLLDRDANLGALLRLRQHFPKAALKLTDDQSVGIPERNVRWRHERDGDCGAARRK